MGQTPFDEAYTATPARPMPPLSIDRNLDLGEAAGRCCSHSLGNRGKPVLDQPPSTLAKDDDCDFSAGQILLVSNVSIGREEHIESHGFSGV